MRKARELTGEHFGRLKVVGMSHKRNRKSYWKCMCNCGNESTVEGYNLTSGKTKSCGCLMKERVGASAKDRIKDLVGKTFNRLEVMERAENLNGQVMWLCKCNCGSETTVHGYALKSGNTKSCGCLHKEIVTTHGETRNYSETSEYGTWRSMISRCEDNNNKAYDNYGGRGIKVCSRWLESFDNFLEDMGRRPSEKHSIDRINVNGGYKPSNCRWADGVEQARNKREEGLSNTGIKGVSWSKAHNKYRAYINSHKYTFKHLGYFDSIEEARESREEAEAEYWEKSS